MNADPTGSGSTFTYMYIDLAQLVCVRDGDNYKEYCLGPADDERLSTKEREDINEKRHDNASDFARVQAGFAPSHAGTAAVVEASTSADIAEIPVAAPDRSPEQGRSKPTNPEPVSEAEGEILRDAPRQMKRKVMMDTGEDAELNQLMDDTRIVRDSDDEVFQARCVNIDH